MRIAFASCMNTNKTLQQPVWAEIAVEQPDSLVLLGDSVYLDVPWVVHPKDLGEYDFLVHGLDLYKRQLQATGFKALVASKPTYAIWDDHDFLWNESYEEKAITRKIYAKHIRASRALFNNYAQALQARLAPNAKTKGTVPLLPELLSSSTH